jgi:hypothetical protein
MPTEIKVGWTWDESRVRALKSNIEGLITLADRLNKSIDRISLTSSKINTGSQGSSVKGSSIKAGSQQQAQGISGALLGDADAATRTADKIIRAFDRVEQKAQKMATTVRNLGGSGWAEQAINKISGSGSYATSSQHEAYAAEEAQFIARGGKSLPFASGGRTPSGAPIHAPSGGGGAGGGGFWFGGGGGVGGLMNGVNSLAAGNLGGFLGSTVGRAGAIGAAVYGTYKLADTVTGTANNSELANVNFALSKPLLEMGMTSQTLAPFRSMAQAGLGRNYSQMYAWHRALDASNPGLASFTDAETALKAPGLLKGESTVSGTFSRAYSGAVAKYISPLGNWVMGKDAQDGAVKGTWDMDMYREQLKVAPGMAERAANAFEQEYQQLNPMSRQMADEIGGNWMSRVKTLRAAGRSTAWVKTKDGYVSAYEHYKAQSELGGWDLGDDASEYQQRLSVGKGFRKILGGHELISSGIEGLHLGPLLKSAGMLTGSMGNTAAMRDLIQNSINGANGLDVSLANPLYGGIMQSALGTGMYGGRNLGWVSAAMGAMVYNGGQDVAGQLRNMNGLNVGGALEQRYSSGSRSGFNQAASFEASVAAAGGTYGAAAWGLNRIKDDPRLLASVAAGNVPAWLDGIVKPEQAQALLKSGASIQSAGIQHWMFANDPTRGPMLKDLREMGGDTTALMKRYASVLGLKPGDPGYGTYTMGLAERLGPLLGSANGETPEAQKYMLFEQANRGFGPFPTGPGAHAQTPKGQEKEAARQQSILDKALARHATGDEVAKILRENPLAHVKTGVEGMDTVKGAGDNFREAANKFVDAIYNAMHGLKAPPPASTNKQVKATAPKTNPVPEDLRR